MDKKPRIAIVGLGVIGRLHAELLSYGDYEVVGLCDVIEERAEYVREQYAKCAKVYTDYLKMVDELKPSSVHICTPHYLHAEMIIEVLKRDINVLSEKPLCINEEELEKILSAEKSSRARLGVCLQNRFNPSTLYLKQYLCGKEVISAHGSVVWKRDEAYYSTERWRGGRDTEGGGVLINQALHTLDLLQWLCTEPYAVVASKDNFSLKGIIEVEDTLSAKFYGTHPFTLFATNSSGCDMPVRIDLRLSSGEDVTLMPNSVLIGDKLISFKEEAKKTSTGKVCYGSGHGRLFDEFYSALERGVRFLPDGKEASRVMRLIFAAYKSSGERVEIKKCK